jgi:hypothetical protein
MITNMKAKTIVWIAVIGIVGVFLAWLIFSPQPGKDVDLQPGTAVDEGWQTYDSQTRGFSIQYPPLYRIEESSSTVAFYIPVSMDERTNLSSDSRVEVIRQPGGDCAASPFVEEPRTSAQTTTIGDRDFSYAEGAGAGAGNLYEEYVYALPAPAGDACYAVRLFIHSGNIYNYEPGTVKEFDRQGLIKTARDMAGTLVLR